MFRRKPVSSNVGDVEIVEAPGAPGVDFGGDRVDTVAVDIERMQKANRIKLQIRLHLPERIRGHEERILHRAVITPKADRVPRRIVTAALIRKTNLHVRGFGRLRLPWEAHRDVNLSPRFRTGAKQRGFSLSWRERRDACTMRQISKTMRLYSPKVELIAKAQPVMGGACFSRQPRAQTPNKARAPCGRAGLAAASDRRCG